MSNNNNENLGFLPSLWGYFVNHQISTKEKVLVVGLALLYALSPIDVIPDFIPILGFVDDIGIGAIIAAYCSWRNRCVLAQQNNDTPAQEPDTPTASPEPEPFTTTHLQQDDNAPIFDAEIVTPHNDPQFTQKKTSSKTPVDDFFTPKKD